MITQTELNKLKTALNLTSEKDVIYNIKIIVNEMQKDLDFKQLSKGDNFILKLKNVKGDQECEAIATPFCDGVFCYHKACFGAKGYTITHVKSKLSLGHGKLNNIKKAVVFANINIDKEFLNSIDKDINPLHNISEQNIKLLKDIRSIVWGDK